VCQTFKLQGLAYSTARSRELALAQLWSTWRNKQGILNLRTLLGGTRIVAVLVNPVFDYESRLLSAVKRK